MTPVRLEPFVSEKAVTFESLQLMPFCLEKFQCKKKIFFIIILMFLGHFQCDFG